MSENGQYILNLKDFDSNIRSGWTSLQNDFDFCDVTLVSDENQINAHKIVLSTCSPVLRHILKKNPHQHPLIYLLGIKFSHLVNLINFMYQGEIKIPQDEINEFLNLGRDLKVVGLSENEEDGVNEKSYPVDSLSLHQKVKNILNEFPIENTNTEKVNENINDTVRNNFVCGLCNAKYSKRSSLSRHIKVTHEHLSFSCDKCPYTATQKESLMHHTEVHDKSTLLKSKNDKVVNTNTDFTKKNNTHLSSKTDIKENISYIIEDDDEMGNANYLLKIDTEAKVVGVNKDDARNHFTSESLETDDKRIKEFNEDSKVTVGSERNKTESSIKKEGVNKEFFYEQKDIFEPNLNYGHQERNYNDNAYDDIKDLQENITETELPAYNSTIGQVQLNLNEPEENLYKCVQCNAKFKQPASLSRHIKSIHERIGYSCEKCTFTATQSASLNRHVQSIHDKIRHFCSWCDYSATQKSLLNKHLKVKH